MPLFRTVRSGSLDHHEQGPSIVQQRLHLGDDEPLNFNPQVSTEAYMAMEGPLTVACRPAACCCDEDRNQTTGCTSRHGICITQ
jgi:hypothetical protein